MTTPKLLTVEEARAQVLVLINYGDDCTQWPESDTLRRLDALITAAKREAFEEAATAVRGAPLCDTSARQDRLADAIRALVAKVSEAPAADDDIQHCPKCGSADCQMLAWVRVNGSDLVPDADPPSDEVYCPTCNVTFHYAELKEG